MQGHRPRELGKGMSQLSLKGRNQLERILSRIHLAREFYKVS